jgi:hypothetical protein
MSVCGADPMGSASHAYPAGSDAPGVEVETTCLRKGNHGVEPVEFSIRPSHWLSTALAFRS